jgi:L-histidine Nalpha-methyltransferase
VTSAIAPTVDVHVGEHDLTAGLRDDARSGLCASPKELSPKWFYDELGCALFDAITRLAEYYPTRCERALLTTAAGEVAERTGADTVVELGSGTSEKTRLLLDALATAGSLRRFVPFDVSESTVRSSAAVLSRAYPGFAVDAVVGDVERHLHLLPPGGRRLVAFLGGTVGNFPPAARSALLGNLVAAMVPGDAFLLGVDLVKDEGRLVAAYDDPAGVTAAFNRNVLGVLNRRLGAHFDLRRFAHVARWDPEAEWVEMRLRSSGVQLVAVDELALEVGFADGEELRTEVSAKFRRAGIEGELAAAGLEPLRWWTDGDYALSLSRR